VQQTLTNTLIPNLPIMVLNNFHAGFLAADAHLAKQHDLKQMAPT
jgi:hypothetical protein